jgi:predicted DNA-binding transcriptional regulator YafY
VLRWVFQFGADAVVLSPPALREEMKVKAMEMSALYQL